jgi:hypothetical protein
VQLFTIEPIVFINSIACVFCEEEKVPIGMQLSSPSMQTGRDPRQTVALQHQLWRRLQNVNSAGAQEKSIALGGEGGTGAITPDQRITRVAVGLAGGLAANFKIRVVRQVYSG